MEDKSQLLMLSLPHANVYRKRIKAKGAGVLIPASMGPIYCLRLCVCVCVTLQCLSELPITLSSSQHVLIKNAVYESLLYLHRFGTGVRLQSLHASQLNTDQIWACAGFCLQVLFELLIIIDRLLVSTSMQADLASNLYIQ